MNELFSNKEDGSNNQTELSNDQSLELLVGEGKKYATTGDLAKAMVHSQNHITTLETEATTLKEQAQKNSSIEEILAAVKSNGSSEQTVVDNQNLADQQSNDTKQPVDITQQIKDQLALQTQANSAVTNVAAVTEALSKALGSRVSEVYARVGKDNNIDLDELSKVSPLAVIKLCTGQQAVIPQQGETFTSQHNHNENVVVTDINLMSQSQLKTHYEANKTPRDERFKTEMANALKQGDSFFN
jgi:ATP-dependent DNA ligase